MQEKKLNRQKENVNKMAWEKPITDWRAGDAPTADAFNRIEKKYFGS